MYMPAAGRGTIVGMRRLTRDQVRSIDRLSLERYGIPGIVLMENAARAVADVAWDMLGGRPAPVLILCGGGNNGGDGLAAARHLHNRGAAVTIGLLVDPAKYAGDARSNWAIVTAMGMPARPFTADLLVGRNLSLVIDAVFGTGLDRPPGDPFPAIAMQVDEVGVPVLAIDVPSGLDCDTGEPPGVCIAASRTVTFVAEKVGFAHEAATQYLGQVTVADIGCPRELVDEIARG